MKSLDLPKVKFERATRLGWMPIEGFALRDLAAAEYEDGVLSGKQWGIFHIKTGMTIPGVLVSDREEAIALLNELAPIEEFSLIKRIGKEPGKVKMPTGRRLDMLRLRVRSCIAAFEARQIQ